MSITLNQFLNAFNVSGFNSLEDPDNRIIALNSKEDNGEYILKLSTIDDTASGIYLDNFNKIKGLSHPNLVFHHSVTTLEDPHFQYNVAEIVQRANFGTLIDYLQSNIKYSQVLKAFIQVFNGLDFLHQNGVLHRDIKPTNVFVHKVEAQYEAKIGDIEFWRQSDEKDTRSTPEYLAPEVDTYEDYTIQSEFWAIGIMLYELFTGKYPFGSRLEGLSIEEIRNNTKKGGVEGIERIPPPFNGVIEKCLQTNIDDRPGSVKDLLIIMESVEVG